jgi:ABC-2 type transport system permease protein
MKTVRSRWSANMRRVWLTARYEMRSVLTRRSFWITTFVLPAGLVLVVLLIQAFSGGGDAQTGLPGVESDSKAIGYVDQTGVLHTAPTSLPAGLALRYPSEAEATAALRQSDIDRYYVVPADYVASGRLTVVQARYQPLRAVSSGELMTYVLNTGIGGDERLARLLLDPTPVVRSTALAPADISAPDNAEASYLLPYLLMFILYLALAMSSGFMLQSVSREKENRTAEMLLVSLRPRDLMLGKILGLSVVGLLQVAIWMAFFFGIGGGFGSVIGIDLHVTAGAAARVIPWTVGYFLFGYLLYSAVYATLGVLTPTVRDANHFVYVAIVPLVLPLIFNSVISQSPNGALAVTLSLVPLTSSIAMVARLGATLVPWWQTLAGLAALAAFAYLFILAAGSLFRAENVLSARALTWSRLRAELRPAGFGGRALSKRTATPKERATARAGENPRTLFPKRSGPMTAKRLYATYAIAAVVVAIGLVEYLVRKDDTGIVIAIVGLVTALSAWARRRRS